MKVLFMGGSRNISTAVSRLLVTKGIEVRLLTRGKHAVVLLAYLAGLARSDAGALEPTVVRVTDEVVADAVEPLGANLGVIAGGTCFAVNNHVWNSGFEPIVYRRMIRVEAAGEDWISWTKNGGVSGSKLLWTGFGNGAVLHFYRIVDPAGQPLEYKSGIGDWTGADRVVKLGEAVVPGPSKALPQGGWVCNIYVPLKGETRGSLEVTDTQGLENGQTWHYVVRAVDSKGKESVDSNEAAATAKAGLDHGPRIYSKYNEPLLCAEAGRKFEVNAWTPVQYRVIGAAEPVVWSVAKGALPRGLTLDEKTGILSGTPVATPPETPFTLKVQDAKGRTASLDLVLNPVFPEGDDVAPEPPGSVKAVGNDGSITLSWTASPSRDVVGYKLYRSDTPGARQQERVYLDRKDLGLRTGDYAILYLKTLGMPRETCNPVLREYWGGERMGLASGGSAEWSARLVAHPGTIPTDFNEPGESCLEVSAHGAGDFSIGHHVYFPHDRGEGQWYSQLHPGAAYRAEVWLRQEGLGDGGKVGVVFSQAYAPIRQKERWTVTEKWQKFTYDFTGPDYPTSGQHILQGIGFTGPGKLWVDNFVVFRNDDKHGRKPFTPHEVSFDELMATQPPTGKKAAIRFYNLTYHPASLDSMFGNYGTASYSVSWNSGFGKAPAATIHQCLNWALATGSNPATRAVPYLTQPEEYTESEWMALVEYLGVPYDPAVDTPEKKPWAYKRYVMRGRNGKPWSDEFREILIEYGNETWHNGVGGYGWDGFGAPGAVHQGGREYGLFARFMFKEQVMRMPAWQQYDLGKKIHFNLGGNYTAKPESGYAELAMQQHPGATYAGHANYVGPKWETGDKGMSSFNDRGVQLTLLAQPTGIGKVISAAAATRRILQSAGIAYRLMAYEGGPSGYWSNKNNPTVDEQYGKSMAMGLSALDAWLYSSQNGFGHQCYLGFASGKWWSSHTMPEAGGFRAHCGWLAMKMRNNFAPGDEMLKVETTNAPTVKTKVGFEGGKEGDVPLIQSYAIKGPNSYAVFVLNRSLGGTFDGQTLGSGVLPVTLQLPVREVKSVMLHKLAHPDGTPADPRDNNIDANTVEIISQEIPSQGFRDGTWVVDEHRGGVPGGIPPGGIYLYVFGTK